MDVVVATPLAAFSHPAVLATGAAVLGMAAGFLFGRGAGVGGRIARKVPAVPTIGAGRLRLLLEAAPEAIILFDAQGRILEWNARAVSLFGRLAPDARGLPFAPTVLAEPYREQLDGAVRAFLASGERSAFDRHIEAECVRANGTAFPAEVAISPLRSENGYAFGAFIRDLTERRQLEERLGRARQREAVARLAGGIAHDFNNLTMAIQGYAELVAAALPEGDALRDDVAEIQRAARRAADLTQQLLAFARKQVVRLETVRLHELLARSETMLQRLAGEGIEVVVRAPADLWPVRIDPGHFEHLLGLLAVHAREAMPGGGRLTLEAAHEVLDAPLPGPDEIPAGEYVVLAVRDSGPGTEPAKLPHIFDPFSGGASVADADGLGLATCYSIARQVDGYMRAESEGGAGTTFRVYLPRAPEAEPAAAVIAAPRGTETVLVVEDEEHVRGLAERVLSDHGYRVLTAGDGHEAIRRAAEAGRRVELVVTDIVMPGMGGVEAARILAANHPGLRVLYISGYPELSDVLQGDFDHGRAYLQKPFSPAELLRKVREVLDAEPARLTPARRAGRSAPRRARP